MDFSFMVRTLLSTTAVDDWRGLNPFIGTAKVDELLALTATMLLHASAISTFNNTMLDCQKLIGSLGKLQEEAILVAERGPRGGAESAEEAQQRSVVGVLASGVVNLADQIASGLHVRRHYVDEGGNPIPSPNPNPNPNPIPNPNPNPNPNPKPNQARTTRVSGPTPRRSWSPRSTSPAPARPASTPRVARRSP